MGRFSPQIPYIRTEALDLRGGVEGFLAARERKKEAARRAEADQMRRTAFELQMREGGYEALDPEVLKAERKSGGRAGPGAPVQLNPQIGRGGGVTPRTGGSFREMMGGTDATGPLPVNRGIQRAGNFVKTGLSVAEQRQQAGGMARQHEREEGARTEQAETDRLTAAQRARSATFLKLFGSEDAPLFDALPAPQAAAMYKERHPEPKAPLLGSKEYFDAQEALERMRAKYRPSPRASVDKPTSAEDVKRNHFIKALEGDMGDQTAQMGRAMTAGEEVQPYIDERLRLGQRRDSIINRLGSPPDAPVMADPNAEIDIRGRNAPSRPALPPRPAAPVEDEGAAPAAQGRMNPDFEAQASKARIIAERRIRSGQDPQAVNEALSRALQALRVKYRA